MNSIFKSLEKLLCGKMFHKKIEKIKLFFSDELDFSLLSTVLLYSCSLVIFQIAKIWIYLRMYSKTLSELWPQQKISNQHKIRIPLLCWHFLQKLKKMFLETPPLWIIEVWKIAYVNRGVRHCVKYQTKEKVLNFPSGSSMGLCGLAPKEKKCILPKIYLHHVLLYASKCYKIGVKAAKICHFSHFQNFLQLI